APSARSPIDAEADERPGQSRRVAIGSAAAAGAGMRTTTIRTRRVALGVALAVLACGCSARPGNVASQLAEESPPPAALAPAAPPEPAEDSRIQAGAQLHVRFTYQPDSSEDVPVRPDGRISLATTGEITAVGLTPSELEALIIEKSAHHLRNPEVVVVVTKV